VTKCQWCNDEMKISHHCSGKKAYSRGYEQALDDNDILHGKEADRFLKKMVKTEREVNNGQSN